MCMVALGGQIKIDSDEFDKNLRSVSLGYSNSILEILNCQICDTTQQWYQILIWLNGLIHLLESFQTRLPIHQSYKPWMGSRIDSVSISCDKYAPDPLGADARMYRDSSIVSFSAARNLIASLWLPFAQGGITPIQSSKSVQFVVSTFGCPEAHMISSFLARR